MTAVNESMPATDGDARSVAALIGDAHRRHWPTVLASTVRVSGSLDVAEECTQDAFVRALQTWSDGVPDNQVGWLTTVARRSALDRLRRDATLRRKLPLLLMEPVVAAAAEPGEQEEPPADLLRLVFTCCHPALGRESQVALTLRLLCGLSTPEVAAVLLIGESAAAARITRAKKKIARAGIPFRIPSVEELPDRLDVVLTVLHLVFTVGHTSARRVAPESSDLTGRAVELTRVLAALLPREPEVEGLLALELLTLAHHAARFGVDGELVLLADQDRRQWDHRLIAEGVALATAALREGEGRFALQAAIAGLHAVAPSWEATDWRQVVRMYDALLTRWPSPVVALNRAAARSFVPGARLVDVLAELDGLAAEPALQGYVYLPATRADVLARLGRVEEARQAYGEALGLCANDAERRFLAGRLAGL